MRSIFSTLFRLRIAFPFSLVGATFLLIPSAPAEAAPHPNILFILPDQWRAQAFGFAGDSNARTPNLDRLQRESVWFFNAVAGLPVCCPTRASLMTGQRALTHGVFLNDVALSTNATTIADALRDAGYTTGYIGKWHLDGPDRSAFIPPERHHGFEYWKVLECTHDYNHSVYFGDTPELQQWHGYDAIAQTRDAQQYLRDHTNPAKPFLLFLDTCSILSFLCKNFIDFSLIKIIDSLFVNTFVSHILFSCCWLTGTSYHRLSKVLNVLIVLIFQLFFCQINFPFNSIL